jgi:hypothetical protein
MLVTPNNRRQLINFLIYRWQIIIGLAAIERVYIAQRQYAQDNAIQIPPIPAIVQAQPCKQIEIIKQHIISILPEARFIDYTYEAQAPLDPNDFVEIYIQDHQQCANKVYELMDRMKVT